MMTEQADHSITRLIATLKDGDEAAAAQIWTRFFDQLKAFASRRLGDASRRVQDEEDLAASALQALCQGAKEGRFRQLKDRDDMWQILVVITSRKASNVRRMQANRREAGESAIFREDKTGVHQLDAVVAGKPTQEFVDSLCLFSKELLERLDDKLREVALLKLAGHTNQEIAVIRHRSIKTIERYLQMIRIKWQNENEPDNGAKH